MNDPKEQERMVKSLEVAIERLQALYNQYFMGIERLEPTIPKKAVERQFNDLRRIKFANTALRFRFQSQVQKYSTHLTHWRRICRQIEEGTYKRDIMRAKARVQIEERVDSHQIDKGKTEHIEENINEAMPVFDLEAMLNDVEDAFEQGFDLDDQMNALTSFVPNPAPAPTVMDEVNPVGNISRPDNAMSPRSSGVPIPVTSLKASRKTDKAKGGDSNAVLSPRFKSPNGPPPRAPQSNRGAAASPPAMPPKPMKQDDANARLNGIDEKRIQSVYRAYVAARKKTNERTDNISLQKITDILKKTEKAKGGVADFKVVIRGGKAVIKAVRE